MKKIGKLQLNDWTKGLITAVIAAVLTVLLELLKQKGLDITVIEWQNVGVIALTAGLSYILKNLGTDEKGKFGGKI